MAPARRLDATDARLVAELARDARATVVALAERLRLARHTVQTRLSRLEGSDALAPFDRRLEPTALGYPIDARLDVTVAQQQLDAVGASLARIPEVLEVLGVAGATDLHVRVVARDADDLYRIAGLVLAVPGVHRTETALVMRRIVPYRIQPLLDRTIAGG